jgi:DNA-damage-inducible protein D
MPEKSKRQPVSSAASSMDEPHVSTFEAIRHVDEHGREYWWARELYPVLDYSTWQKFEPVLREAMGVCQRTGGNVEQVFNLKVKNPSTRGGRPSQDYRLTRHACYLIVLSASGNKDVIALA